MAWAWRIAVGDPGAVPAIARQVDWLAEHRDLDGDGLMWIVQPDESGLDSVAAARCDLEGACGWSAWVRAAKAKPSPWV